ncbi:MAG: YbhN family protein [Anaerolineae bacterium]
MTAIISPKLRPILGHLVLAVVLFFLGRALYANWEQVREYRWTFDYPLLALSIIAVFGTLSLYAWQWKTTLNGLGVDLSFPKTFRIWFIANLGRYVPGKVWQFVGWFYLCEREGATKVQTLTSIAINQVLQNVMGLALAFVIFAATHSLELKGSLLPLLVLIPLGALAIQPRIMEWTLNRALQFLGRGPVTLGLSSLDLARFALTHLLCWLFYGLAFYLLIKAIYPAPLGWLPAFTGIFAAAYVMGFVSLLTPGGLGVREGALAYLLGFYLPPHVAIVISLLSRLWITAAELIGTMIALWIK